MIQSENATDGNIMLQTYNANEVISNVKRHQLTNERLKTLSTALNV